jgi:hypothetical protein
MPFLAKGSILSRCPTMLMFQVGETADNILICCTQNQGRFCLLRVDGVANAMHFLAKALVHRQGHLVRKGRSFNRGDTVTRMKEQLSKELL